MSIEQHAEAAAEKIVERYDEPHFDFVYESITKHIQAAIDEATSPLRARIAELEGLWPLIETLKGAAIRFGACEEKFEEEAQSDLHELEVAIWAILKGGAP